MDSKTEGGNTRTQTEGEYKVGVSFNPSKNPTVDAIKGVAASAIDMMAAIRDSSTNPEVKRCAALAITQFEDAAMWGVKAATKEPR